jgi:hypothetical protein
MRVRVPPYRFGYQYFVLDSSYLVAYGHVVVSKPALQHIPGGADEHFCQQVLYRLGSIIETLAYAILDLVSSPASILVYGEPRSAQMKSTSRFCVSLHVRMSRLCMAAAISLSTKGSRKNPLSSSGISCSLCNQAA